MFVGFFLTDQIPDITISVGAGEIRNGFGFPNPCRGVHRPLLARRVLENQAKANLRPQNSKQVLGSGSDGTGSSWAHLVIECNERAQRKVPAGSWF